MVCFWFEPRAAEWKAQMNPLSYGGTLQIEISYEYYYASKPESKGVSYLLRQQVAKYTT